LECTVASQFQERSCKLERGSTHEAESTMCELNIWGHIESEEVLGDVSGAVVEIPERNRHAGERAQKMRQNAFHASGESAAEHCILLERSRIDIAARGQDDRREEGAAPGLQACTRADTHNTLATAHHEPQTRSTGKCSTWQVRRLTLTSRLFLCHHPVMYTTKRETTKNVGCWTEVERCLSSGASLKRFI
jgi:hypothetical protein